MVVTFLKWSHLNSWSSSQSAFLPRWAAREGLAYMTLVFPSRFSGSLQHQQAPRGTTVGEQSLMALCPTSCGVLVICDSLFGLVHSKWATENWLRKISALPITLSWCRCTSGREGPQLSLCYLTCSFVSLTAVPKEIGQHAVRVRPLLCPPIAVVHSMVLLQERQWLFS